MTLFAAKKYHAYARECLRLAEWADNPETRHRLVELSRSWVASALNEEKHHFEGVAKSSSEESAPPEDVAS
jgi:hypothetical protein